MGNKPGLEACQWYKRYVIRILNNRAVLGEFQPCTRNEQNKSMPQGDPITDYYPPVVNETDFVAARRAIYSRALGFKRTGKDIPNIFGKLIRNARDGCGWLYIPAKKKAPIPRLEPVGGRNGTSAPLSFRYPALEAAFLKFLKEITADDLTRQQRISKADQLEWEVADLNKRIGVLEARLDTDPDLGGLLDKLGQWKTKLRSLEKELEPENNPTDKGKALASFPENLRERRLRKLRLLLPNLDLVVPVQRQGV